MEIQVNDIILCLFSMIVYTITSSILMHYKVNFLVFSSCIYMNLEYQ